MLSLASTRVYSSARPALLSLASALSDAAGMSRLNGNEIRVGMLLERNGKVVKVVKANHQKMGRGAAFMQVEFRDIVTGSKSNEKIRSSETVDRVYLDEEEYEFVRPIGKTEVLLENIETGDELEVDAASLFGAAKVPFLERGMEVKIGMYEGEPVTGSMPDTVVVKIVSTEPFIKGQTATGSYKPAELENGVRVKVPPFVTSGEDIIVHLDRMEYVGRDR